MFSFSAKAANYLDIKGLLDVTCKTVANMIKGKTPEEIRKTFNTTNTPMSDDNGGDPLAHGVQCILHKLLARGVEGTCGFVQ